MTVQKINCVQVGQIIQINILHVLLAWMFLSAETNSVIQIRHAIDRRFSGSVYAYRAAVCADWVHMCVCVCVCVCNSTA